MQERLECDELLDEATLRGVRAAEILFAIDDEGNTTSRDCAIAAASIYSLCRTIKEENIGDIWGVLEKGLMDLITEDYLPKSFEGLD